MPRTKSDKTPLVNTSIDTEAMAIVDEFLMQLDLHEPEVKHYRARLISDLIISMEADYRRYLIQRLLIKEGK